MPMEKQSAQNGKFVTCERCAGAGFRTVWSFGVKEPDECPDCGGSGRNWQYSGGAIAKYYAGPLLAPAPRAALSRATSPAGAEQ